MDTLEQAIRERYERATPVELALGRSWYGNTYRTCAAIARESDAKLSAQRVAAIVATLSPRCHWQTNLEWTRKLVSAHAQGSSCPAVSTRTVRDQAWRIAKGARIETTLTGAKRRAFYRSIVGDQDSVCIDVWIARVCAADKLTPKVRQDITEAFRKVAADVGETPRDLQAIVWTVERGSAE